MRFNGRGTTSAVQAMVLSVAKRGEKIILPRNVHRSVMAPWCCAAPVPVYVNPECEEAWDSFRDERSSGRAGNP